MKKTQEELDAIAEEVEREEEALREAAKAAKAKKESEDEDSEDEEEDMYESDDEDDDSSDDDEYDDEEEDDDMDENELEGAIANLLESEDNLTEEFKEKAQVIFTAALSQKTSAIRKELAEASKAEVAQGIEENYETLCKKVDSYITFALNEWIKDNDVAIESNLQAQVAEEFLGKVHGLFVESYLEVPEDKRDAFHTVEEQNVELTNKLEESRKELEDLKEANTAFRKEAILSEATKDLAETDKSRIDDLLEGIEFTNEDSYKKKIGIVIESFLSEDEPVKPSRRRGQTQTIVEDDDDEEVPTKGPMGRYLRALGQNN
jgi:hypothetical protein